MMHACKDLHLCLNKFSIDFCQDVSSSFEIFVFKMSFIDSEFGDLDLLDNFVNAHFILKMKQEK